MGNENASADDEGVTVTFDDYEKLMKRLEKEQDFDKI